MINKDEAKVNYLNMVSGDEYTQLMQSIMSGVDKDFYDCMEFDDCIEHYERGKNSGI